MKVVVFIGPAGSGKGTQADILAEKFGFFHFETSKFLEAKFQNADPNDQEMQKQKKIWDSGALNDPTWVAKVVLEETKKLSESGKKIVLSASPRTLFEAEKEIPEFEKWFGRDNIAVFNIALSGEESIKRNSHRRICQKNRHPIPNFPQFKDLTVCLQDGSPLMTRELDKPEAIRVRYREYLNRTFPILDFLRQRGYQVIKINGEQSIEDVTRDILKRFP